MASSWTRSPGVWWAAFVVVEGEVVDGAGQDPEDVEGGLAGAGFVAAQLGDVDADGVGEGLLGQAGVFARGREAVSEGHVLGWVEVEDRLVHGIRLTEGFGIARISYKVLSRLEAEVSVQRLVQGCGVELRARGRGLVGRVC